MNEKEFMELPISTRLQMSLDDLIACENDSAAFQFIIDQFKAEGL